MRRDVLAAALFCVALAGPAAAHPLDPALLELRETPDSVVEVLWRLPSAQPRDAPLEPVLPERCRPLAPGSVSRDEQRVSVRWRMDCGSQSLVGERLGVQGLGERQTDALVRLQLADGRLVQAILRGDEPFLTVPPRTGPARVFRDYLVLGTEHILTGLDHLLFVLGLVLLVRGRGPLLWTLTAFTAGHSITLSLAVLGFVRVPVAAVEVLIALSIFAVAVELTRRGSAAAQWRSPWAMAFLFGLLHGLGFAGALAEVGLPAGEIPLALVAFNCGIELGQIAFVAVLLLARAAFASLPVVWPRAVARIPAYVIGSLAAFWVFERLSVVL
ncbi:MAG TPA: HupE/UreJ family protein [Thermoanaerobaculia bacterium]